MTVGVTVTVGGVVVVDVSVVVGGGVSVDVIAECQ